MSVRFLFVAVLSAIAVPAAAQDAPEAKVSTLVALNPPGIEVIRSACMAVSGDALTLRIDARQDPATGKWTGKCAGGVSYSVNNQPVEVSDLRTTVWTATEAKAALATLHAEVLRAIDKGLAEHFATPELKRQEIIDALAPAVRDAITKKIEAELTSAITKNIKAEIKAACPTCLP
jgi:hypothetical protein